MDRESVNRKFGLAQPFPIHPIYEWANVRIDDPTNLRIMTQRLNGLCGMAAQDMK
jgi:hypothetical protein